MKKHQEQTTESVQNVIQDCLETILETAIESKDNPIRLLEILRKLERLHQEIRDTLFQEALPDNRQALYVLLKDIEATGGWPYIYRTKLSELLERLSRDELNSLFQDENSSVSHQ